MLTHSKRAQLLVVLLTQTLISSNVLGILTTVHSPLNSSIIRVSCPCIIDISAPQGVSELNITVALNSSYTATGHERQHFTLHPIVPTAGTESTFNHFFKYRLKNFQRNELVITFGYGIGYGYAHEPPLVTLLYDYDSTHCPILFAQHPPTIAGVRNDPDYKAYGTASHVVGGAESGHAIAAYLVLFTTWTPSGSSRTCTGTMLSSTLAVTAAHCNLSSLTTVTIGTESPDSATWESARVAEFVPHPQFNIHKGVSLSSMYDIAYVRLVGFVPDHVRFMTVASTGHFLNSAPNARVLGYGILQPQMLHSNPALRLHQVDLPLIKGSQCAQMYKQLSIDIVDAMQICAGYVNKNCGAW